MLSVLLRVNARSAAHVTVLRCMPGALVSRLSAGAIKCASLSRTFAAISIRQSALKAMDQQIKNDVVVYTYENARFFRLLSTFGVVQFVFWLNMAGICYGGDGDEGAGTGGGLVGESTRQTTALLGEDNQWSAMMRGVMEYRHKIGVLCLVLANVIILFTWFYPQRSIKKLTLLTGGKALKITTYSPLGKSKDFTVPLNITSFMQARDPSSNGSLALKVKGRRMYFLLDQKNGKFMEPTLFDFVVGLKRKL